MTNQDSHRQEDISVLNLLMRYNWCLGISCCELHVSYAARHEGSAYNFETP